MFTTVKNYMLLYKHHHITNTTIHMHKHTRQTKLETQQKKTYFFYNLISQELQYFCAKNITNMSCTW